VEQRRAGDERGVPEDRHGAVLASRLGLAIEAGYSQVGVADLGQLDRDGTGRSGRQKQGPEREQDDISDPSRCRELDKY
jgi:hypothetical protein